MKPNLYSGVPKTDSTVSGVMSIRRWTGEGTRRSWRLRNGLNAVSAQVEMAASVDGARPQEGGGGVRRRPTAAP